jgi:CRP/FNR family transcriptional regulator, cyclic AMP receptor protein
MAFSTLAIAFPDYPRRFPLQAKADHKSAARGLPIRVAIKKASTLRCCTLPNFGQLVVKGATPGKTFDMDKEVGLRVLASRGWLSATPVEFQRAILSLGRWQRLEVGESIQAGGEELGELIGLAEGAIEMRTILGPAETPLMHIAHPVFWLGYVPLILGKPRRLAASAKLPTCLARIPQDAVGKLLAERPDWWRFFLQPAIIYGDVSQTVAADLLINDSERRCAAVLLRMAGRRFATPDDKAPVAAPLTQDELAGAANMSRNSVGTMLRKLAARGLVKLGYRTMIVLSPAAMRAFVEQG